MNFNSPQIFQRNPDEVDEEQAMETQQIKINE